VRDDDEGQRGLDAEARAGGLARDALVGVGDDHRRQRVRDMRVREPGLDGQDASVLRARERHAGRTVEPLARQPPRDEPALAARQRQHEAQRRPEEIHEEHVWRELGERLCEGALGGPQGVAQLVLEDDDGRVGLVYGGRAKRQRRTKDAVLALEPRATQAAPDGDSANEMTGAEVAGGEISDSHVY
jgi:hypothetical protein